MGKVACYVEAPPAEPCSVNLQIDYYRELASAAGSDPDPQAYCPAGASFSWAP